VIRQHPSEKLVLGTLLTLTNIAVLNDWHDEFFPALHSFYGLVDSGSPQIKLQTLKLLVNLSCNEDMIPSLLAAQVKPQTIYRVCISTIRMIEFFQAPKRLIYLLDPLTNEEILLRVVTLLANLTTAVKDQEIDPSVDLPAEDKAASPDTM